MHLLHVLGRGRGRGKGCNNAFGHLAGWLPVYLPTYLSSHYLQVREGFAEDGRSIAISNQ